MTYNQASYIEDAMNGFCMQQTTFPFVCTIVDDASTDGEQEVIKRYLQEYFDLEASSVAYEKDTDYGHITFARHKTNRNCFYAVICLKENHYSQKKSKTPYLTEWMETKYIAFCEGDDYWIDPLKLQKQVDFLEGHPDYSLCCHRYKIYNQNEGTWDDDYVKELFEKQPDGFTFGSDDNLRTWITKTMTLMYRSDRSDDELLKRYKYRCDEHMNYHLLQKGPGYCFPFIGAVYRRCDMGLFSPLSEEAKTKRFFLIRTEILQFNLEDKVLRDVLFTRIRRHISSHELYKEMKLAIATCLTSYYRTDGLWMLLQSIIRIFRSYVCGLKKRTVKMIKG
jgi:glycosyltransferase involved in cell wall biosynthesis